MKFDLQQIHEGPLTVAWVLEEEAWGTLVEASAPDQVRALFAEVALDVLRMWSPKLERVVYGDSGVPDTCVRLDDKEEGAVECRDVVLGEDYWKHV